MAALRACRACQVVTLALAAALQGCAATSATPAAVALDQPLPALSFVDGQGAAAPLSAYAEPSASSPHLLVVRVMAGWCGPCRWHAAHTGELLPAELRDRVKVLDLLVAGDDNAPAAAGDVAAFAARGDGVATVVTDPGFQLAALFPRRPALPLVALVDTRTLTPRAALSDPAPEALTDAVRAAVAKLDGQSAPQPTTPTLVDGRFTGEQWALVQAMALPAAAPVDATNAHESDPAAIALGKLLFFDGDLSPSSKKVSCGACHVPDLLFQDGKDQSPEGVGVGSRNVPSVILAADQRWLFWDGRADSAWAQAIMPIEDPNEMASSRLYVAHVLSAKYRQPTRPSSAPCRRWATRRGSRRPASPATPPGRRCPPPTAPW
jgi:cytochrome c peroxidase